MILFYWIPDTTNAGIITSKAQYDKVDGTVKIAKEYREEIFNEMSKEINSHKEKGILNYTIAGDFNQNVTKERIRCFMRENSVQEIH